MTLSRREDLERREFAVEGVSFVAGEPPADGAFAAEVRIRHRAEPVPGLVRRVQADGSDRGGRWQVELERPAWAPAPGQAAVFYSGDEVIGGGRIADQ